MLLLSQHNTFHNLCPGAPYIQNHLLNRLLCFICEEVWGHLVCSAAAIDHGCQASKEQDSKSSQTCNCRSCHCRWRCVGAIVDVGIPLKPLLRSHSNHLILRLAWLGVSSVKLEVSDVILSKFSLLAVDTHTSEGLAANKFVDEVLVNDVVEGLRIDLDGDTVSLLSWFGSICKTPV